jgi:hypothetical protein
MRTTLNIEDEALEAAGRYAEERDIPLGKAVSDLVYLGVQALPQFRTKNGWVVFDLPAGTTVLNQETLDAFEKTEHDEEYERAFSPRR